MLVLGIELESGFDGLEERWKVEEGAGGRGGAEKDVGKPAADSSSASTVVRFFSSAGEVWAAATTGVDSDSEGRTGSSGVTLCGGTLVSEGLVAPAETNMESEVRPLLREDGPASALVDALPMPARAPMPALEDFFIGRGSRGSLGSFPAVDPIPRRVEKNDTG